MDIQPGQVTGTYGDIPFGQVDAFGVDWAWLTFDGWGAPGSTIEVVQKPRSAGAWAGDAFARPYSLAMSGEFYAPTPEAARAALDRLNNACSLAPNLLTVNEAGLSRSMMVRRSDVVLHKWISATAGEWSIQVVALDPRKLYVPLTATTRLPSTTGGLTIPYTIPYTISAVQVSGQVNLTNPGNTSGPVTLRIDGPCTGPIVTHVGSGLSLVFASSLVLNAGEWLDINMEARTVLANGQASRSGSILTRGWSSFYPGSNTWSFTAAAFASGALLTVTATPADK